jgi:hypothetical protein
VNSPFDANAEDVRLSLSETIAWCAKQIVVSEVEETEQERQRLRKIQYANELRKEAYRKGRTFRNRLLRRNYMKNPEWKLSIELLRQAQMLPMPLTSQLRSPDLKPNCPIGDVPEQGRKDLVDSVIAKRSFALHLQSQLALPNVAGNLHGGRLMLYTPSENFEDGASQGVSGGFFDVCDAPPWDIWVSYANGELLSWVPPELIELVQAGIDVNPVQCIRWLD